MFATRSEDADNKENLYNYVPTEWAPYSSHSSPYRPTSPLGENLFRTRMTHRNFAVLHIAQALFPTAVLSGITEILGWSGRLWVSTLIMAPTNLIATNFMVLGKLIRWFGANIAACSKSGVGDSSIEFNTVSESLLPPPDAITFLACDTVALVVQSVGGGIASGTHPDLGGHIALGGIVLQLVALLFFTFIAGEFLPRFASDRPIRNSHANNPRGVVDRNIGFMIAGLSTMTILLLIRSIYGTIELSDGWTGTIIPTQWLFILHPGVLLRGYDCVKVGPSTEKIIGSPSFQSM
ncbi:RTA1-like protein [Lactarius sanguifluus]|nr:RTA1-like protein [Lactarius sanguifluus]